MKRLLCILSNVNAGGAETFLMKLYRVLDKSLYQIDFCISVKEKCFYEDEILSLGGLVYRIPSRSESFFGRKKYLKKIISNNNYKYVLRVASNPISFIDLAVAKKAGASLCSFRSSNSNDGGGFLRKIINCFFRIMYMRYIDVKIAPSDLAAIFSFGKKECNRGNVNILNNGIDIIQYSFNENKRDVLREELNIKEAFVIGNIGRFNEQKNHKFLLEVFKEILSFKPNSKLVLIGEGYLKSKIIEFSKELKIYDKILFLGVKKDVVPYLCSMDAYVFPSLYEGMPNTVIEAQSVGLSCYLSDTITKDVKITNNVHFLPLNENSHFWAEYIVNSNNCLDKNANLLLKQKGFDIDSCVEKFVQFVFGNNDL